MSGEADPRLKEYEIVVGQFRELTNIRFRLLGFLPLGTVGTMIVLKDKDTIVPLIGLFGVVITAALFVYHLRNDQLYNELVSRAAQLERELGLFEGNFTQRPQTWHRLGGDFNVEHGWPVKLVYVASAALWLSFALYPLARGLVEAKWGHSPTATSHSLAATAATTCCRTSDPITPADPKLEALATIALLPVALLFVWAAMGFVTRTQEQSRIRLKLAVRNAMDLLERLPVGRTIHPDDVEEVAHVLRRDMGDGPDREAVYLQRLRFYLDPRYTERYLGAPGREPTAGPELASRILAQTIDFPARWIFDIYMKRR